MPNVRMDAVRRGSVIAATYIQRCAADSAKRVLNPTPAPRRSYSSVRRSARSELGRGAREKLPVRALLLPVHQDVQLVAAFLAVGETFAFAHPVEPHDGR